MLHDIPPINQSRLSVIIHNGFEYLNSLPQNETEQTCHRLRALFELINSHMIGFLLYLKMLIFCNTFDFLNLLILIDIYLSSHSITRFELLNKLKYTHDLNLDPNFRFPGLISVRLLVHTNMSEVNQSIKRKARYCPMECLTNYFSIYIRVSRAIW